uniref:Uncharacterized protein n=1 Tax=Rhizophora mucronata TaxID=61149 RepID=A0A2P2QPS5_RHIMU
MTREIKKTKKKHQFLILILNAPLLLFSSKPFKSMTLLE